MGAHWKVNYRDIDAPQHEVVFVCMPLRLTVFVHALLCIVLGVFMYVYRSSLALQVFGGGYTFMSHFFLSVADFLGVACGAIGAVGCWQNRSKYTSIFYNYQYVRGILYIFAFLYDRPAIYKCEQWIVNVDGAMKEFGWNPVLFDIAFKGRCLNERFDYMTFTLSIGFLFFYLGYVSKRFEKDLEKDAMGFLFENPNGVPVDGQKNDSTTEDQVYSDTTFVGWTVHKSDPEKDAVKKSRGSKFLSGMSKQNVNYKTMV